MAFVGAQRGRKQRRIMLIVAAGSAIAVAVGLILYALSDTVSLFKDPTQLSNEQIAPGTRLRLGGLVKDGSWQKLQDGKHSFVVTDKVSDITVTYTGIVPDLFREGQGVVLDGTITAERIFVADTVLAKHDENYVPKEVVEALKKNGQWQHNGEEASK